MRVFINFPFLHDKTNAHHWFFTKWTSKSCQLKAIDHTVLVSALRNKINIKFLSPIETKICLLYNSLSRKRSSESYGINIILTELWDQLT